MLSLGPRGRRFETRTSARTLQKSYTWSQERLSTCLGEKGVDLLDLPQHTSLSTSHEPVSYTHLRAHGD